VDQPFRELRPLEARIVLGRLASAGHADSEAPDSPNEAYQCRSNCPHFPNRVGNSAAGVFRPVSQMSAASAGPLTGPRRRGVVVALRGDAP